MGQLVDRGHELTPDPKDADVLVVNTCSFIDPAKKESVDTILEMAEYKKSGRAQRLIVAGCLVERYRDDIRKNIPEVDAVLGTNELESIVTVCEGRDPAANPFEPYLYHDLTPRVLSTARHYAYIKIAEGCDHPCSFCVIPQYRGKFRSRRFESVIAEAIAPVLAGRSRDQSHRPGHHVVRRRPRNQRRPGAAHGAPGADRDAVRKVDPLLVLLPEPDHEKLLDTIAEHAALVKYIDMPLQHSSAVVLKRMKRGSHGEFFLKLLERIRATIPGVAVRTSMIVGFPGESEADFESLCDFVQAARFDRLGVFSYSDEDTSASYQLDQKVDARTIYNRKRRLMSVQRRVARAHNRGLIGQEVDVLVDGPSPETDLLWQARMSTQAPEIDGVCYVNDFDGKPPEPGQIRRMRITEAHDYDLVGRLGASPESSAPLRKEPFPILAATR